MDSFPGFNIASISAKGSIDGILFEPSSNASAIPTALHPGSIISRPFNMVMWLCGGKSFQLDKL